MSFEEIITAKHDLASFDSVIISELQEADLEIVQNDDREELIVKGIAEIVKNISTKVVDKTLTIQMVGSIWKKLKESIRSSIDRSPTKYTLYVKNLRGLEINGIIRTTCNGLKTPKFTLKQKSIGKTTFKNFHTENLGINIVNVGKIRMEGKATEQYVTIKGTSEYDASNLESIKTQITLNGIGDAILWVKEDLQIEINGIGTVSYYGSPVVNSKGTLLSNVNKLGMK
jgi:hypothetical protein